MGGDEGSDSIAVAGGAGELEFDHATFASEFLKLVTEDSQTRSAGAGEGKVEPAVPVIVEEGEGTCVFPTVDSADEGVVLEAAFFEEEEAVAFISAEGIAAVSRAAGSGLLNAELKIQVR